MELLPRHLVVVAIEASIRFSSFLVFLILGGGDIVDYLKNCVCCAVATIELVRD